MAWWGWVIGGAILFGAELTVVSAQFYLVFIGSAAILVGLVALLAEPAPWLQWGLFAVLALVSMVTFRSRVYARFGPAASQVRSGPPGGMLTLTAPLPANGSCQSEHGGTFWTVQNESNVAIPSGTRVRITSVRDLTLLVKPE